MRRTRAAAAIALFGAFVLCVPMQARASAGDDLGEPAIEPGQEALLTTLLGHDASLPNDCDFSDGAIEYSVITATYRCNAGIVVLRLVHSSHAPKGALLTESFAISVENGAPPESLVDAVAASVRDHEQDFEWTWNTPDAADDGSDDAAE
jgi:hypothetical protein